MEKQNYPTESGVYWARLKDTKSSDPGYNLLVRVEGVFPFFTVEFGVKFPSMQSSGVVPFQLEWGPKLIMPAVPHED